MSNEVALKENRDLIHKLFYWSYPEGNVLSKTKLASIAVFLFLFIIWTFAGTTLIYIPLSVFFAGITFLLGLAFHKMVAKPSALQIKNNDLGLVEDIKNLLFFWQDKNDQNNLIFSLCGDVYIGSIHSKAICSIRINSLWFGI